MTTLPSIEDLKTQAKRLRTALGTDGKSLGHGQALELVARQHGYRDWNTLHAAVGNRPAAPLSLGDRVTGRYLGQPFDGEIIAAAKIGASGPYRVTIQFDEPVDVVTFESFSAYRSRVTCTVDRDGVTAEKTSNGQPHMTVRRFGSAHG